jgi:hypothetical protein
VTLGPVGEVTTIDRSQWRPEQYDPCYHYISFARMANMVLTGPGPLPGWFSEAVWRQDSYCCSVWTQTIDPDCKDRTITP